MTHNDFLSRLEYAARTISAGGDTRCNRQFHSCLEMYDGDEIVVALYRRTLKRPDTKLARNIWRYLCRESVESAAERLQDVPDLEVHAAETREKAKREFNTWLEAREVRSIA